MDDPNADLIGKTFTFQSPGREGVSVLEVERSWPLSPHIYVEVRIDGVLNIRPANVLRQSLALLEQARTEREEIEA